MEPFIFNKTASIPHFSLSHWEREFPHLTVGFSSKKNNAHWSSSNFALHVGDDRKQVIENRRQLAEELGLPFTSWTSADQVHGTHVSFVTEADRGKGRDSLESALPNTDGLITDEVKILLATYYADCVPLYFYSPDIDMIGTVHAGWKGTVGNIVRKVIEAFVTRGSKIENIRTAIGPSNGACCYVVDEKVIKPFKAIIPDETKLQRAVQKQGLNQWTLNLKEANKILMQQAGILEEHINVSSWCTSCHSDYFHSHRRDAGNTGRMVAWIGKKGRI